MADQDPIHTAVSRLYALLQQRGGTHIVHTSDLSRADRELLLRTRWLQEIMRGWYFLVRPGVAEGDSTAWYANFWDFLAAFLSRSHGTAYCLSAECSLDLHVGSTVVPNQIIVMADKGGGVPLQLPHDTSLLVYAAHGRLPKERTVVRGLQAMTLAYALCKASPTYFRNAPRDAEIALRAVDPTELLGALVAHRLSTAGGRLIGAYRFLGHADTARAIEEGLRLVGIVERATNPFSSEEPLVHSGRQLSPAALRIAAMWAQYRLAVLDHFPSPPGLPSSSEGYLDNVEGLYTQDAYHSLSIEGYHVSNELLERVRSKGWDPDHSTIDAHDRDALAARGYYEAFCAVRGDVARILLGESAGEVVATSLPQWYQKLFSPSAEAGIVPPTVLFGYRRHQVFIRGSRHVPLPKEALADAMEALFECLKREPHPAVRAVLGHFVFVFIHPYMDGNGRIGRFLMNAMMASGGYPWTIIPVTRRAEYMAALEAASVDGDIRPFAQFVASCLKTSS